MSYQSKVQHLNAAKSDFFFSLSASMIFEGRSLWFYSLQEKKEIAAVKHEKKKLEQVKYVLMNAWA